MLADKMSSGISLAASNLKVFFYGFVIDFMYVLWFSSVAKSQVLLAGAASILLALPGILGFFSIVENKKLTISYLIGLACGTMASMSIF
jgi:hypothetical protein